MTRMARMSTDSEVPSGTSFRFVPQGHPKIARRFIVGSTLNNLSITQQAVFFVYSADARSLGAGRHHFAIDRQTHAVAVDGDLAKLTKLTDFLRAEKRSGPRRHASINAIQQRERPFAGLFRCDVAEVE